MIKLSKTQIEILTELREGRRIHFQVYRGAFQPQRIYITRPDKATINIREVTFKNLRDRKLIEILRNYDLYIHYTISQAGLEALASLEVAK
jgi:hypothetical protein